VFSQFGNDKVIIVRIVRQGAVHATLNIFLFADVRERTAAVFADLIERTIAKQAVERSGIAPLVAGEKSTIRVFKKFVTVLHRFAHKSIISK
jgi:hypothetical protein